MTGKNGDSTRGSKGGEPTPEGDAARSASGGGETTAPMPKRAFIGEWIGQYRAIEILGEGGFGVVLLAERREPMVQRVAIKVIRPGHDSRDVVARFEQERQLLAMLDHPNIAKVFDAGETDDGRPYFVMELVRGDWITRFADRRGLTRDQRLELFLPVCDAMQHAHRRGVIHRDLKPGNILVAEADDGSAMPKVIDFGIAKALAGPLTDKTLATRAGGAMGSPHYMSPEQALGTEIDASSDVYGLSAVLYELLTGKRPLEHLNLSEVPDQMLGITVAAGVVRRPREVTPDLPDELETILLRGLSPDRTRRYSNAGELGDDVRRYLAGEPVSAKRDGVGYVLKTRVRALVAHNVAASALVAWAVCTLLAYFVGVSLLYKSEGPSRMVQAGLQWIKSPANPAAGTMPDVRVVEFTDSDDSDEIAAQAMVPGVTLQDPKSERRLHAAVMKRAARARASVIVIDISFSTDSPHDGALGEAIDVCRAAGTRMIFGCSRWPTPLGEAPRLSSEIVRRMDGSPAAPVHSWYLAPGLARTGELGAYAVIQRQEGEPVLHGAVLAFAASRRPDCNVSARVDAAGRTLILDYLKLDEHAGRVPQKGSDSLSLMSLQPMGSSEVITTLAPTDEVGIIPISVAGPDALHAAVRSLKWALTCSDDAFLEWVGGKILVIGDARTSKGDVVQLRGRKVYGSEVVASAVQCLLDRAAASSARIQVASSGSAFATVAIATGLGVLLAKRRKIQPWHVVFYLVFTILLVASGTICLYIWYNMLADPISPVFGLMLGAAAGTWISLTFSRFSRVEGASFVLDRKSSLRVRP
ncbi:MAG: protein kinase [Phycisphaerales bacterium]